MLHLYIGHDQREAVGTYVFLSSLLKHSRAPIPVTILHKQVLERAKASVQEGTNAFTLSRFLVPYFQNWSGWAIFMDGADMLLREDIYRLFDLVDQYSAVQVVKHEYTTKHPKKYVGTSMEANNTNYERKNWASVMLMNCAHYAWRQITPDYINRHDKMHLLQFKFMEDRFIGDLPIEWNWLVDEFGPDRGAKLLHWTCGVPGFKQYRDAAHAGEWFLAHDDVNYHVA